MVDRQLSDPITLRLPQDVLEDVQAIAEASERTRSWVIVRALKLYLAGEGEHILSIRKGREESRSGDTYAAEDVIREMEKIVAGKVA